MLIPVATTQDFDTAREAEVGWYGGVARKR
jgi:hypothetical protein